MKKLVLFFIVALIQFGLASMAAGNASGTSNGWAPYQKGLSTEQ